MNRNSATGVCALMIEEMAPEGSNQKIPMIGATHLRPRSRESQRRDGPDVQR